MTPNRACSLLRGWWSAVAAARGPLCHLLAARIWQGSIEHCRAWAIRAVPVAPRFYTCTDAGFIVRTHGSLCTGLGYPPCNLLIRGFRGYPIDMLILLGRLPALCRAARTAVRLSGTGLGTLSDLSESSLDSED